MANFLLLVFSNLLATTELLNVGHIGSRKIWSNFLTQYMDVVSNKNSSVLKIKQKYHYKFYKKAKAVILYSTQEWTKSNQDRISSYNTDTISSRWGVGIKRKYPWGDYWLIQYQILQTNIIIVKWQMVRRITNEITVKVLMESSFIKALLLPKCSWGESSSLWWKATIHSNNLYSVTRLGGNKTKLRHWKLKLLQTILKNFDEIVRPWQYVPCTYLPSHYQKWCPLSEEAVLLELFQAFPEWNNYMHT